MLRAKTVASTQGLVDTLESTRRWVSWGLRDRLASRLETRRDPVGMWSTHVAQRRLSITSGERVSTRGQLAQAPAVSLPDVAAAFDALEPYIACYDDLHVGAAECTMELALVRAAHCVIAP